MNSTVEWKGDMSFDTELDGHHFMVDADSSVGGKNLGPKPKGLVLSGLAGCTAMDIIAILKKMEVTPASFKVKTRAKLSKEHPKVFTNITISYIFEGENLDIKKLKKAVHLSDEIYCGVSAMLKQAASVENEIIVNGTTIS